MSMNIRRVAVVLGLCVSSIACGTDNATSSGNATPVDLDAVPAPVATLSLEVAATAIQQLEADPFHSPDVAGAFVDDAGQRSAPIDVNFRGAYALQSLIESGVEQRNWKLKFAKEQPYHARREWNFNYEPHIRQRLAYWLMRTAGVHVPSARHVVLRVNGAVHGLYLEYEDPDNKAWLLDEFGNDQGDLYKAAYDLPDEPTYFATFEKLGNTDADYSMHYNKKTNNDDPTKAADFSALRGFINGLNDTPESGIEAYLRQSFEVDEFVSYLVVANFTSHWDSYPQRPKNFWLYQNPGTQRWSFIPWDMDATFQPWKAGLNAMGTNVSVLYQFDQFEDYPHRQPEEGTQRVIVTRMMKVPAFRSAYLARYREALTTFLAKDYLLARVALLHSIAAAAAQPNELEELDSTRSEIEDFIEQRSAAVMAELARLP